MSYNSASPEIFIGSQEIFYIVRNHLNTTLDEFDSRFCVGVYDTPDEGFVSTWWVSELWNSRISEIYEIN